MKKTLIYFFIAFALFCVRQYIVIVPDVLPYSLMALFTILLGIMYFQPTYARVAAVALIPVVASIVESTFGKLDPSQRMIVLYGTSLSLGIAFVFILSARKQLFALPTKLLPYLGAYGFGIGLGLIGFLITPNQQLPYITNISLLWILLPFFAFTEEIVFRKLLYEEMKTSFGEGQALAGTAVLYAAMHVGPTVVPFVVSYLASILLTTVYKQEHNLWISFFGNIVMKITFLALLLSISHTPLITYVP